MNAGILSGGAWQESTLKSQHIELLAVHTKNPDMLFAGSADGRVFFSTDAGLHWHEQSAGLLLPAPLHTLLVDPAGEKIYAASDKGLFVTATTMKSAWTLLSTVRVGLPADRYTALAMIGKQQNTLCTATAAHGLLLSTDGGTSWRTLTTSIPQSTFFNNLVYIPDQKRLWAATSTGIYRSDNMGVSWRSYSIGLPSGISVLSLAPAESSGGDPNLIYAGTDQGFFLSRDSGAHWGRSKTPITRIVVHSVLVDFRSTDASTVYLATDVGALSSQDSGQDWGNIGSGLPKGQAVYSLALGADNYSQLYAALNTVYQYPGNSSGLGPSKIVPLILIAFFFYLLLRTVQRTQRRQRTMLRRQPPLPGTDTATRTPDQPPPDA